MKQTVLAAGIARLRGALKQPWVYPLLLLAVCWLAYALQVNRLGFYWDDWEDIFLNHLGDPAFFWRYFAYDRPFTAWVYAIFFPLLGASPVRWQVFELLLRWAGLVGFWWTFRQLWPGRSMEAGWIVLLLAVYPGFTQQAVAVTYSRHFVSYALLAASLCLMVLSVQKPRLFWVFMPLGVAASFVQMMTIEYLVGLELLRPVFLYFLLQREGEKRLRTASKSFVCWLPYLAAVIAYAYWRFFIFTQAAPDPQANAPFMLVQLLKSPLDTGILLLQKSLQDIVYMVIFVWTETIQPEVIDLSARANLFAWGIGLAAGLVLALHLAGRETPEPTGVEQTARPDHFRWQSILVGVLGIVLGGLPVWSTDRQITAGLWSDRFALGPMFGAAVLLVGLVVNFGYHRFQKSILLGVIFGLAVSSQIRVTNKYRLNWEIQRDYYWQTAWRIPALKPGTAVLGTKMPFGLVADYSVGFALNTIYSPGLSSTDVPVWFMSAMRYRGNEIPDFKPDLPVKFNLRMVNFNGSTSNSLVVHYKAGQACVRVLTPDDRFSPLLSSDETTLAGISNIDQILPRPERVMTPPVEIFGAEPVHDWCYFFEKADLARQMADWAEVARLGDEAEAKGFLPATGMEWVPFIEGYAHTGNWGKAEALTGQANLLTEKMTPYLCATWERIEKGREPASGLNDALRNVRRNLDCKATEG